MSVLISPFRFLTALIPLMAMLLCMSCHSAADKTAASTTTDSTVQGKIQLTFTPKDTGQWNLQIAFAMPWDTVHYDFDIAAADTTRGKGYELFWDQPNSSYVGVLQKNGRIMYYHASQQGRELQVLESYRVPEAAQKAIGNRLLHPITSQPATVLNSYAKHVQSGGVIDDFKVDIIDMGRNDSVAIRIRFGGYDLIRMYFLPQHETQWVPTLQPGKTEEECLLGYLDQHRQFRDLYKVRLENGQVRIQQLRAFSIQ